MPVASNREGCETRRMALVPEEIPLLVTLGLIIILVVALTFWFRSYFRKEDKRLQAQRGGGVDKAARK